MLREVLTRKVLPGAMRLRDPQVHKALHLDSAPGLGVSEARAVLLFTVLWEETHENWSTACCVHKGKKGRNNAALNGIPKTGHLQRQWFLTGFKFHLKWQEQYYRHKKSSANSALCIHIPVFFFKCHRKISFI